MAAHLRFGEYESPTTIESHRSEWVIVSIWGASGEFISLSWTNADVVDQTAAPPGLQPSASFLGILLANGDPRYRHDAEYLLLRHRPEDVLVGGVFHPSDGYVRVERRSGLVGLTARGRFAHSHGQQEGTPVVRDVPDPAPGFPDAKAWHLTAEQRPWIGEYPSAGVQFDPPLAPSRSAPHTSGVTGTEASHDIAA